MDFDLGQILLKIMMGHKKAVRSLAIILGNAYRLADKELLAAILREERRHYYLLEGIYEEVADQAACNLNASISLPKSFNEMLKTQICAKLNIIEAYEDILGHLTCARHQELAQIILADQKEHARIMAGIYNRLA